MLEVWKICIINRHFDFVLLTSSKTERDDWIWNVAACFFRCSFYNFLKKAFPFYIYGDIKMNLF